MENTLVNNQVTSNNDQVAQQVDQATTPVQPASTTSQVAPQPAVSQQPVSTQSAVSQQLVVDPLLTKAVEPEDLEERWSRWKCLICGFVYEGRQALQKCPKCGNEDPDKFEDAD